MRVCLKCSHPAKTGSAFCGMCGTALPKEAPRPAAKDPILGRILGERFRIEEQIGVGAFGTVYLGTHVVLDRQVAIKLLHPSLLRDQTQLHRFYREALAAGAMNHPNLVGVLDLGETDAGAPYLVMDYVEGVTVEQALQDEPQGLPSGRALDIALQVARALRHVHERGIVHRDIKPSNIMLTVRDGDPEWAVVLDFGIAKVLAKPLTRAGEVLGTPGFIPPEYLLAGECGLPADIYALGATLFEMLAGRPLFDGATQQQVIAQQLTGTPPTLLGIRPALAGAARIDPLITRMVARRPELRPTAAETMVELEALRAQLPRRSEEGQVLARTALLPEGPALHDARTVRLPPGAGIAAQRTRLFRDLLSVDQLCARLAEASASLWAEIDALGAAVPEAARPLLQAAHALEEQEHSLGVDLAMAKERILAEQKRTSAERQALLVRVLDTSGALGLRGATLPPEERQALSAQRLALERQIQALGEQATMELHAERFALLGRLNRVQREQRQNLLQIAQLVCGAPQIPTATRRHLEELREELQDTVTLLRRHEQSA